MILQEIQQLHKSLNDAYYLAVVIQSLSRKPHPTWLPAVKLWNRANTWAHIFELSPYSPLWVAVLPAWSSQ